MAADIAQNHLEALERQLAGARAALERLNHERRGAVREFGDRWHGGHRERFEVQRAAVDAMARRIADDVAEAQRLQRRMADERALGAS